MSDTEPVDSLPSPPPVDLDSAAMIAALRRRGGERINPVRFHFIEALAKRAQAQPESVRHVLDAKLAQTLADYMARFEQAQNEAKDPVQRVTGLECTTHPGPLGNLVSHIQRQTSPAKEDASAMVGGDHVDRADLKSLRYFRDTWSRLSVDQTVKQALATGPSNAGPLNSHSLVLQSLQLMRDASPDYLNRFMAYADTLLWLDQARVCVSPQKAKSAKKPGRGGGAKKLKSDRSESTSGRAPKMSDRPPASE